jgi:CheY-like chemotaxis protein
MELARSILIVDDDEDIREALRDALTFEGLVVSVVRNGEEAIEWLRTHVQTAWIILLDLMMPVMDGRTFLNARACDPVLARSPVIVLTAGGDCREFETTSGVFRCFPKTVEMADLLAAIYACA